ncbi:MAG: quinone oxidoreductase family protein [Ferrimicrobium sp.]
MKAIQLSANGGPEVLEYVELPTPLPGRGEVQIKVAMAGINFIDIYQREGVYALQLPAVLGSEGAGTVLALGEDVEGVQIGDRVAWSGVLGSYAEVLVAPAHTLVPVPTALDLHVAAALMLQGMTAHYLTNSTFPVEATHICVVHAAAGGVGSLLTQLIVNRGGVVIATTSTPEKAEAARANGAQILTDYDHFHDRALEHGGAHVVYDGVGQATFDQSLASLRPRGLLALYGAASGQVPPFDLQRLNAGGSLFVTRPSLGHYVATRSELLWRTQELFDAVAQSQLTVTIGSTYPLREAAQAHRDLASRATKGKLLLAMD